MNVTEHGYNACHLWVESEQSFHHFYVIIVCDQFVGYILNKMYHYHYYFFVCFQSWSFVLHMIEITATSQKVMLMHTDKQNELTWPWTDSFKERWVVTWINKTLRDTQYSVLTDAWLCHYQAYLDAQSLTIACHSIPGLDG